MTEASGLSLVDLTILAILLISGILAFIRGLVREIFALGTWVGAFACVIIFFNLVRPWVHKQISNPMGADAATAVGLFALALIILIPIGSVVSGMVKGRTLTSIDSSLGLLFGMARGFLILSLVYMGITWIWSKPDEMPKPLAEAKMQPLLAWGANYLRDMIPSDVGAKAAEKMRAAQDSAADAADNVKKLEDLSVPVPSLGVKKEAPSYEEQERENLDTMTYQQDPSTGTP